MEKAPIWVNRIRGFFYIIKTIGCMVTFPIRPFLGIHSLGRDTRTNTGYRCPLYDFGSRNNFRFYDQIMDTLLAAGDQADNQICHN